MSKDLCFFSKYVQTQNEWNSEIGVGSGIDIDNSVIVGFQQKID